MRHPAMRGGGVVLPLPGAGGEAMVSSGGGTAEGTSCFAAPEGCIMLRGAGGAPGAALWARGLEV